MKSPFVVIIFLSIFVTPSLGKGPSSHPVAGQQWYKEFRRLYPQMICDPTMKTRRCYTGGLKKCVQVHQQSLDWCLSQKKVKLPRKMLRESQRKAYAMSLGACSMRRFVKSVPNKSLLKSGLCRDVYQ